VVRRSIRHSARRANAARARTSVRWARRTAFVLREVVLPEPAAHNRYSARVSTRPPSGPCVDCFDAIAGVSVWCKKLTAGCQYAADDEGSLVLRASPTQGDSSRSRRRTAITATAMGASGAGQVSTASIAAKRAGRHSRQARTARRSGEADHRIRGEERAEDAGALHAVGQREAADGEGERCDQPPPEREASGSGTGAQKRAETHATATTVAGFVIARSCRAAPTAHRITSRTGSKRACRQRQSNETQTTQASTCKCKQRGERSASPSPYGNAQSEPKLL